MVMVVVGVCKHQEQQLALAGDGALQELVNVIQAFKPFN